MDCPRRSEKPLLAQRSRSQQGGAHRPDERLPWALSSHLLRSRMICASERPLRARSSHLALRTKLQLPTHSGRSCGLWRSIAQIPGRTNERQRPFRPSQLCDCCQLLTVKFMGTRDIDRILEQ